MESNHKIIFMTGATSGFGKISALKAAKNGSTLLVLARNKEKGQALCTEFKNLYPNSSGKIEIIEGDLSSFDSVHSACKEVILKYTVIDMIVNNAGIMNFESKKTINNIEETLQVNLLTPVLICHLLFENLKKSNDPKIIFTSSGLHQGEIHFDNLEFKNSFSSFKVYRQSKLGVILICRLLSKYLEKDKVGIYSQHPGMVRTNLGQRAGWFSKMIFYLMGKSPKKGSQNLSFLIETPNSALKSGEYYADKKITTTTKESYDMEVAKNLLQTIYSYIKPYIKSESVIFSEVTLY
ncbi:MAG: SDR family NAD(P)-dependent oxidoreductase [Crocinitomicaceae bacterium]